MKYYIYTILLFCLLPSFGFAQETDELSASELFDKAWQFQFPKEGKPNIQLAIKYYRKTIEKDPFIWDAYNNLGAIYLEQKKLTEADKILTMGIQNLEKKGEKKSSLYVNRAGVFSLQSRWSDALADANKSISIDPNYPYAYEIIGNAQAFLKEYPKSIISYNKAIFLYDQKGQRDEIAAVYFNRGISKSNLNNQIGAIADWDRACKLKHESACKQMTEKTFIFFEQESPKIVEAILSMAFQAMKLVEGKQYQATQDEYQSAVSILEDVIYIHDLTLERPKQKYEFRISLILKKGAKIHLSLLQHKKYMLLKLGEIFYKSAVPLYESDLETALSLLEKGLRAYQKGESIFTSQELLINEDFQVLLQFQQNIYAKVKEILVGNYVNRANKYDNDGQFDKALDSYAKAIELDHKCGDAFYNRGFAYFNAKKYDLAIQDFSDAIKYNTNYLDRAYYFRGHSNIQIGRYEESAQDLERAIELNPRYSTSELTNWIKTFRK